jgi:CheY-like chemotaxis protein
MDSDVKFPGQKVLIVEDDMDTTLLFKMALERAGHRVEVSSCARQALGVAGQFKPGVILIDIGLPDMNGHRLALALRAQPALTRCRLIAVTGHTAQSMVARSIAAGFEAHLTKPVSAARLLNAVSGLT